MQTWRRFIILLTILFAVLQVTLGENVQGNSGGLLPEGDGSLGGSIDFTNAEDVMEKLGPVMMNPDGVRFLFTRLRLLLIHPVHVTHRQLERPDKTRESHVSEKTGQGQNKTKRRRPVIKGDLPWRLGLSSTTATQFSTARIVLLVQQVLLDWFPIKFMYSNQLGSKHNPHRGSKHSAPAPLAQN
ncbi:unnamed protein product [Rhizoctonia solani]|uniref:Uncharacterized protein n=1 Tax=Rhizoctonia solani TaxID=456999 RepID=A0A8H3BCN2_9AGAM|nr:unnamed protein product [Rhizoctonia solani]